MCSHLRRSLGSFFTGSDAPKVGLHLAYTFVNGWLNGLTLRRYGAFSTMMVGNTILFMASLTCIPGENEGGKGFKGRSDKCPQPPEKRVFFAALIGSFCVGAIIAHVLGRKREWSTLAFAPIFICVALLVEGAHMLIDSPESQQAVPIVLACIFGMSAHLTLKGGLGALPWCTTGNIISACFHGVTLALSPNDEDGKKMLSNILLWVSFSVGVGLGVRNYQEGYLLLCTCLLGGLLCINDSVFMKRNTAMGADSVGHQDAGAVQASSSETSVSSMPSVRSQTSMGHAAGAYEAARASFDMMPYLSTKSMRPSRASLDMQHQALWGMQPQASRGLNSVANLKPIREGAETLDFGAVRGTKP